MKELQEKAEQLGIVITDQQAEQFQIYYDRLIEKNKVMNLTAITEYQEVIDKHFIDRGLVKCVEADHRFGDLAVDVLDRKLNALAAVTAFVAVAQLAGFVHTGGRTGGDSCAADGAVVQRDLYLDSRVAAGVKDLAPHDVYYFKILLHIKNLLIGYMVIIPYRAGKIKMFVLRNRAKIPE